MIMKWAALSCLLMAIGLRSRVVHANGESLYGVHWWDWDNGSQVNDGPDGGWSTETVLTHSAPWWAANYFQPLYQNINANHGASIPHPSRLQLG